jgi:hypothetical protein
MTQPAANSTTSPIPSARDYSFGSAAARSCGLSAPGYMAPKDVGQSVVPISSRMLPATVRAR